MLKSARLFVKTLMLFVWTLWHHTSVQHSDEVVKEKYRFAYHTRTRITVQEARLGRCISPAVTRDVGKGEGPVQDSTKISKVSLEGQNGSVFSDVKQAPYFHIVKLEDCRHCLCVARCQSPFLEVKTRVWMYRLNALSSDRLSPQ